MLLLRPPGVYTPQADTSLLREAAERAAVLGGARVLDVGTGTGAVAVAAARGGAARVTAIDISARAVLAARINAKLRGLRLRVLRGDLFAPVAGETFDVILANPPYVTCGPGGGPRGTEHESVRYRAAGGRTWDGGAAGRLVLDRICAQAPRHLRPGGTLLIVQSALSGVDETVDALDRSGMKASVVARRTEPFGPVMLAKAAVLESRGLIRPGQRHEELVVIRADREA